MGNAFDLISNSKLNPIQWLSFAGFSSHWNSRIEFLPFPQLPKTKRKKTIHINIDGNHAVLWIFSSAINQWVYLSSNAHPKRVHITTTYTQIPSASVQLLAQLKTRETQMHRFSPIIGSAENLFTCYDSWDDGCHKRDFIKSSAEMRRRTDHKRAEYIHNISLIYPSFSLHQKQEH